MKPSSAPHYWHTIAAHWNNVGHPLRPNAQDIDGFTSLLNLPGNRPLRILILGVTPELYGIHWPNGSEILAADRSEPMIKAIWPGPPDTAFTANWTALPFDAASFDAVLCDGGLHLQRYPTGQRQIAESIARILKPNGRFLIRLFALPDSPESPEQVFSDLHAGRIPSLHIFKLRLAMALQKNPESGVILNSVYARVIEEIDNLDALQELTGWPANEISSLSSYDASTTRYSFLNRAQSIQTLCAQGKLALHGQVANPYPLGERCPILSFRKSDRP